MFTYYQQMVNTKRRTKIAGFGPSGGYDAGVSNKLIQGRPIVIPKLVRSKVTSVSYKNPWEAMSNTDDPLAKTASQADPIHGEGWGDFTRFVKKSANTVYRKALKPAGKGIVKVGREVPGATKKVLGVSRQINKVLKPLAPLAFVAGPQAGMAAQGIVQGLDVADQAGKMVGAGRRRGRPPGSKDKKKRKSRK